MEEREKSFAAAIKVIVYKSCSEQFNAHQAHLHTEVPNTRADRNKQAGWQFFRNS